MRIALTAAIVASLGLLVGADTTYNVISTTGKDHTMGVIVDGKTYPLKASEDIPVLHSGTAPSGAYTYAKLNNDSGVVEKEPFQRHLNENTDKTLNEFYNRTWNTQSLSQLPKMADPLPYVHRINSNLHAKDQIPTIYLSGDQAQIDVMHGNATQDTKVSLDMHFIETDKVTAIKGVEIKLAGRSSRWLDKLSYTVKTPKDQSLYGYRRLKLRALRADPAYIREILCYDMMNSMGLPVSGASYARVIMNDQPIGLFLMIEAYKDNWYENEFADGKKLESGRGASYQGYGGSDMSYMGENVTLYQQVYKIEEDADKKHGGKEASNFKQVVDFTKAISQAPTSSPDAAKIWNQLIDMEGFIRSMVIEVVAGFSDGYMVNANNFFLYDNLAEKRMTYLAADFDTTVGNTLTTLADQWSGNYTRYPGFLMRPMTTRMIQIPEFKARFEQLLHKAANELINDASINPRINDLVKMISEDVEWDAALPKMNKNVMFQNMTSDDVERLFGDVSPPVSVDAIKDMTTRRPMSLRAAVYDASTHISLPGVTQWFGTQSKAIQSYFTQHPPSS